MKSKFLLFATGMILVAQTLVAQVPSYVPTNGIVGYWPFNGNANDESGNGNNGTVNGATLTTDRFGNVDSAFSFDGINDFIQLQCPVFNNSITISFWAYDQGGYPNNFSINPRYVSAEFCNGGFGLVNNVNDAPNGFFFTRNRGISSADIYSNSSPTYNVQQHIIFTYDGSIGKFYLNGNLISSVNNIGTISSSSNLYFGKSGCPFGQMVDAFKGKLDDIGIWNRALTQQEITTMYNGSQTSSYTDTCNNVSGSLTQGLVGYWPFCGNANDDSDNGNNGTVNGATLTTDRFGNSNSAYSFDGVNDEIHIGQLNLTSNYSISFWSNINNSQFQYPIGFGVNQTNTVDLFKGYGIGYSSTVSQCPGLTSSKYFVFDAVSTCNNFIECNNIISPSQWNHVVMTKNGNLVSIYINGTIENSNTNLNLQGIINLYFGVRSDLFAYFNGKLDDIGIWNRALTPSEVTQLYNQNQCFTNITVTDTLIINVGQLSYTNPIAYSNNITIAPNPASTQININFNNITDLNGGTIKIINSLGQQVATTPITTSGTNTTMSLATWGGNGMYFVQIINPQGQIVDIKKIILQ